MADLFFVGVEGGETGCRARLRDGSGALVGQASGVASRLAGIIAATPAVKVAIA